MSPPPADAGADPGRVYRDVIGRFATGVTVVTASGPGGPAGMTTNAVASLSLEPLLLLVCFDRASRTLPVVRQTRRFAVNVLAADQAPLAVVFASKRVPAEKFDAVAHREAHGVPVLDGAAAWVACELRELVDGGDHEIAIGAVLDCSHDPGAAPLVWVRGAWTRAG